MSCAVSKGSEGTTYSRRCFHRVQGKLQHELNSRLGVVDQRGVEMRHELFISDIADISSSDRNVGCCQGLPTKDQSFFDELVADRGRSN